VPGRAIDSESFRELTAIARAVEVNRPYLLEIQALVSFLSQRNQKENDSDPRENHRGGEARGRDFGFGMVVFFKVPSEANQETENANTERNQPDRSLVVGEDFHGCGNHI
jgi:hypothetical protein